MSTETGATFHFRHFQPTEDLAGLVQLMAAVETADQTGEDVSEELLRDQLTWPGHDPVQDRWVVEEPGVPGSLIGLSVLWKTPVDAHGDLLVAVHPAWRWRGLGNELLQHILDRARELRASYVFAQTAVHLDNANAFMQRRGFWSDAAFYTALHLPAGAPVRESSWPASYSTQRFDTAERFPTIVEVSNRSYHGLWGHRELTQEEVDPWLPEMARIETFLALAPTGQPIGICRAQFSDHLTALYGRRTGSVDAPGIFPEERDSALYLPLLLTAVRWLRAQKQEPLDIVMESWGDTAENLALYQDAGFMIDHQNVIYRKDLA